MNFILNRRYFRFGIFTLLAAGTVLRLTDLSISLQYDEIWTLEHYVFSPVWKIFSELSTPNNHPLNSLLFRILIVCGADSPMLLRVPSLFAGIGSLLFIIPIAWRLTRSKSGVLLSLGLLAFNPWAVLYSAQGRGYSLQLFLLLVFAWCVIKLYDSRCNGWRYVAGAWGAAVGAILTLSTTVLFLPVPLVWVWWKKRSFRSWILVCSIAIFSGIWYGMNFEQLRQGQQFGRILNSCESIGLFLTEVPGALLSWPILFFASLSFFCARGKRQRVALTLLAIFLLPLLAAFVTRAGMTRVYLPLILPGGLLAALGTIEIMRIARHNETLLKLQPMILLFPLVLGVFYFRQEFSKIRMPDWEVLFSLHHEIPKETLIVYPGNAALAAYWNNRNEIGHDYAARLQAEPLYLLQIQDVHGINGISASGGEESWPIASAGKTLPFGSVACALYPLKPFAGKILKGELVIAILPPQPPDDFLNNLRTLQQCDSTMLKLNFLFFNDTNQKAAAFVLRAGNIPTSTDTLRFYRIGESR